MKNFFFLIFLVSFLFSCNDELDTSDKIEGAWIPDSTCTCAPYCNIDSLIIDGNKHRTYIDDVLINEISFIEFSEDETIFYYFDQNVQFMQITNIEGQDMSIQYLDEANCTQVSDYTRKL